MKDALKALAAIIIVCGGVAVAMVAVCYMLTWYTMPCEQLLHSPLFRAQPVPVRCVK